MRLNKICIVAFVLTSISIPVFSQFSKGIRYEVKSEATFSGGDYAPFWLTSNRHGLSSVNNNNGYLRTGIFRPLEADKKFSYALGLDIAAAYQFTSVFVVQQAYADLKYSFLNLSIGSKEYNPELKNERLSTGGMALSNNARPIPQVRVSIPNYVTIPGTRELFAVKAHLAYGRFTDDNWQRNFATPGSKYTEKILYHSKAIYAKIGNEQKFPLVFEGGLEMAAQFGGNSYNPLRNYPFIDMPNGVKDYFKVFIPLEGDDDTPKGEQDNVYGNHLGSWNFSLSYKFPEWKVRGYYEHHFDDHSMMFGEYGWKDCLAGMELTLPKNPFIENIVYEYIITKDQSGPIYYDHTEQIPDQVSAVDDYYNHYIYTGWHHWGMAVGNPMLTSPIYNKDGKIIFKNNRVQGHHIGISGQPSRETDYRILLSHSRNWGTYDNPFYEIEKNTSVLFELGYRPAKLPGWKFSASFAFDRGDLIGNNTGGMISVRKTGTLFTK